MTQFHARISTDTDTELIEAPGAGKKIRLQRVSIYPEALGDSDAGLVRLEEGAASNEIVLSHMGRMGPLQEKFVMPRKPGQGYNLPANTALSAETSGGATWVLWGEYEIVPDYS